jgi:hypothetical protein
VTAGNNGRRKRARERREKTEQTGVRAVIDRGRHGLGMTRENQSYLAPVVLFLSELPFGQGDWGGCGHTRYVW